MEICVDPDWEGREGAEPGREEKSSCVASIQCSGEIRLDCVAQMFADKQRQQDQVCKVKYFIFIIQRQSSIFSRVSSPVYAALQHLGK